MPVEMLYTKDPKMMNHAVSILQMRTSSVLGDSWMRREDKERCVQFVKYEDPIARYYSNY